MDEKRYIVIAPLFDSRIGAARYIGKDKAWLDRAQRKPEFKRALEIRLTSSDEDVGQLLDGDLQSMLRADIAGWVQSAELDRKEKLSIARLLVQMTKADTSTVNNTLQNNYIDVDRIQWPSWMRAAKKQRDQVARDAGEDVDSGTGEVDRPLA